MSQIQHPIFFMHIPKTAGTSLRLELNKHYKQSEIFPNERYFKKNGKYPGLDKIENFKKEINASKFFIGHYPLRLIKKNHPKFSIITFLRDPVERTISHLKHFKSHKDECKNMSLDEIFDVPIFNKTQFDNLQTRYLLNIYNDKPLKLGNLNAAKRNLKTLKFVGITENYKKSVNKLSNLLDIAIDNQSNENQSILQDDASSQLVKNICKKNYFDIELYNLGRQMFEKI